MGVSKGLSEYFNISLKWIRIVAVIALVFTGFWPGLALLTRPKGGEFQLNSLI
jgi:phage shock protein C